MSIQKVIQESIAGNPLEMKEALAEELKNRFAEALAAKMEEVEQLDEISKSSVQNYIKAAKKDRNKRIGVFKRGGHVGPYGSKKQQKNYEVLQRRHSGLRIANAKIDNSPPAKEKAHPSNLLPRARVKATESFDLDEETKKMKDGYYVTNQRNSEVTHDKPFNDSKSAISHANKGENKTGYVHRVHKVKDGKIDKQWEYNGGHHEGGWEHFSDFKGDAAHQHMRNIPKHFFHGHNQ